MIRPLPWDSDFFQCKIGTMSGDFSAAAIVSDLKEARAHGFTYLTCRPPVDIPGAIRNLSNAGFYLTDIGAIWSSDIALFLKYNQSNTSLIRQATAEDLPRLTSESIKLFRLSRFYCDPFFSEADANRLHVAWITNSVNGRSADVVLINPDAGFVTCKVTQDGHGEVPLIGVWSNVRRKGAGRELMHAAVLWLFDRGQGVVRVKTQVRNLAAMNFYHRLGFDLCALEMTMSCMLKGAERT